MVNACRKMEQNPIYTVIEETRYCNSIIDQEPMPKKCIDIF